MPKSRETVPLRTVWGKINYHKKIPPHLIFWNLRIPGLDGFCVKVPTQRLECSNDQGQDYYWKGARHCHGQLF